MKRLLIVCAVLLALTSLVLLAVAQEPTIDPAAYFPARASIYVELRSDESGIAALDTLSVMLAREGQGTVIDDLIVPRIATFLPNTDFRADILPWVDERMALSAATTPGASPAPEDFVFVLPIGDTDGAQAFVERVAAGAASQDAGGVQVYTLGTSKLAVSPSVIWLGEGATIDSLFSFALENLSQNAAYQQVRAALPAEAPVTVYVSGAFVSENLSARFSTANAATLWQAALRLHPAQSPAEETLLVLPPMNGVGFTVQVTGSQVDLIAALSMNAQYPAPTLATASAGTALLDLIPPESSFAFASYDLMLPAFVGSAAAILTTPVTALAQTAEATPAPDLPLTADALLAQTQPLIRQIESTMGISLAELYTLVNGEYTFVQFPNGAGEGGALYLQSANPQRLIDTLDRVSHLLLTNPDPVERLFMLEQTTISSTPITLISSPSISERFALGILPGNVLFVAPESSAQRVIDAASNATSSPLPPFRNQFGTGQEAFFIVSGDALQTVSALILGSGVPAPFSSLSGTLDVRENGLFVLRVSASS